ncbi:MULTISPECIES: protease SohB [Alteromonas]|uniref:protease SohB n=1 Tax=Alteromonas TaxID=226 RepID=UPI0012708F44|nr:MULTISPECIES: protease SohB [Alteromonas]CAI2390049.1 inner membrane peptidase. Serine peptidase. MEROPS family S49 [Alteromonas macleodii]CAI3955111.1 inner membrane peptidase. Serine peptidase. MEROPS family S49 [Alteromonas macleodii]CAI3956076.1 inner membrane peptidase. Serine peptidase. MEROPS family S49 [Alteromonas macleodii]CAI3956147.1 inner membrane peptidase. Serine peptidase. MEROPS family S49 [Alteromonas macleodii]VTO39645.1 inner membrane peptidase. Serine peptidase. MEROPS 
MEFLYEYGLFVAKAVTLVIAFIVVVSTIVGLASKQKHGKGQLEIVSISEQLKDITNYAKQVLLDKNALKKLAKEQKKEAKAKNKSKNKAKITEQGEESEKSRLYVIDFKGSMDANEVEHLREEITAILCVANKEDEVLVRLESGGGVVHGYGLAASQLQRIKEKGLKLTIAVDKVAASGGYMMACVADKLLASQFAYIGSIGVLAQLPNFNKLLKKNDIEFEQHTAGEFKRTLTVFGENNDEGRAKFKEEIEEIHVLFKDFVQSQRPDMDIDKVATGEYWPGIKAKSLGLIDDITTSDDYILSHYPAREIFSVKYAVKKNVAEKLGMSAANVVERVFMKSMSKARHWF